KLECLEMLKSVALNSTEPCEYQDHRCDAISALCRLDCQDSVFLDRLSDFLLHRTTSESYAIVAGLPYMTPTESVRGVYRLATQSGNLAVREDFARAIALSGRHNTVEALQKSLIALTRSGNTPMASSISLSALSTADWMADSTRRALLDI